MIAHSLSIFAVTRPFNSILQFSFYSEIMTNVTCDFNGELV